MEWACLPPGPYFKHFPWAVSYCGAYRWQYTKGELPRDCGVSTIFHGILLSSYDGDEAD